MFIVTDRFFSGKPFISSRQPVNIENGNKATRSANPFT